jgi:hypothetical protein
MSDIGILQQLRGIAHNSRVTAPHPDPPQTLSAAEEKFGTFLTTQNYPKAICWLMPSDVVVGTNHHYWVRFSRSMRKNAYFLSQQINPSGVEITRMPGIR